MMDYVDLFVAVAVVLFVGMVTAVVYEIGHKNAYKKVLFECQEYGYFIREDKRYTCQLREDVS